MIEILTAATVLTAVIMGIRKYTIGRISMRFRYALWLLVALRLILPVSPGNNPYSILNLVSDWSGVNVISRQLANDADGSLETGSDRASGKMEYGMSEDGIRNPAGDQTLAEDLTRNRTGSADSREESGSGILVSGQKAWHGNTKARFRIIYLWMAGILITGGYMMAGQFRFVRFLHRRRIEISGRMLPEIWQERLMSGRMHVYSVAGLPSPCLVGRNIYMAPDLVEDKARMRHVLAHEYAHARQGDGLWMLVRSAVCAVYWFFPVVWLAACAAKRDSELACDEQAIRMLGENERFAYGRTLLTFFSDKMKTGGYTGAILIMGGRENSVKERVRMIAGKRKNSRRTSVLVAIIAVMVCGCTFTGAKDDADGSGGTSKEIILTNEGDLSVGGPAATEAVPEAGQDDFEEYLQNMDDSGLTSAESVDLQKYYDFLYEDAECPLQDGNWYRLAQKEEEWVEFYGLYTKEYGCRGVKIKIGDDVNTFDQPWLPTSPGIEVAVLEKEDADKIPRSFAYKECVVNNSDSEIWRLYVADRYDTGTIEIYCFETEDALEQIADRNITLLVDRAKESVALIQENGTLIGEVDISAYGEEEVEEAMWDNDAFGYLLGQKEDGAITLLTSIGLKAADSNELKYRGLSLIGFSVDIGRFGEHKFTLGEAYVEEGYVNGRVSK